MRPWVIRLVGISALSLLTFYVFFHDVGRMDVSRFLPWTRPFHLAWPDLPQFFTWQTTSPDGQRETIYQVPTRQLTKTEIARMEYTPGATNSPGQAPAKP